MSNEKINPNDIVNPTMPLQVALGWLLVSIPLAYGTYVTFTKAAVFFGISL